MSDIYLVRHGQDEDNAAGILNGHRNTSLTELGRKQASEVGKKLIDNKIEFIYSSPLNRAFETAEIISKEIGVEHVEKLDDLIERDFGVLTGKPVLDIPKYAEKILDTDRVKYFLEAEGAEDFPTLYKRAEKVLVEIQQKHPEGHILLVTHGDLGKMIRAVYHKWTWEEGLNTPYLDNTGILELKPVIDVVE